jgi:choline dehydrogenase-like flavoprotein
LSLLIAVMAAVAAAVAGRHHPFRARATHPVRFDAGNCLKQRTGNRECDDVVDHRLRVRGVSRLRVADASVLPVQLAGNTQAPTMAVAWIAAGLILEDS